MVSEDIEEVKVGDFMTAGVEAVAPDETLQAAAERMRSRSVGMLVVVDGGKPVGVLTDRDVTVRATAAGRDPRATLVREAMTAQVLACRVDDDIEEAARRMEAHAVRRLVILDPSGRAVGILSVDDLAARLRDEELAGEIVRQAAEPGIEP